MLIACANVSHMQLARAAARREEIPLRSALGAGQWDMFRQFLTESLTLALMGGVAGLVLAIWGVRVLIALPVRPPYQEWRPSVSMAACSCLRCILLLTGLVFGMAPAWRATRPTSVTPLKEGERGSSEGLHRNRLRGSLVASEFALAVILLAGAGLMVRTFLALQHVDPGFEPSRRAIACRRSRRYGGSCRRAYRQFLSAGTAESGRGTRDCNPSVASIICPLRATNGDFRFTSRAVRLSLRGKELIATYRVVFPGYFRTMSIPVLRGRDVTEADNLQAPGVVVINNYFARRYWPGEDAIGKRITFDDPAKNPSWLTVVGVVKDTARSTWVSPPEEEVFLPYLQNRPYLENPAPSFAYMTLVARTTGEPEVLVPAIRTAIHSLDKNIPLSEIQTMDQVVAEATGDPGFT